jgi:serine/threonine protein kinase
MFYSTMFVKCFYAQGNVLQYRYSVMRRVLLIAGDNILSDGQGNIKLGDFGIAVQKILNSENHSYFIKTSVGGGGGTAHWLAPEILLNAEGCSRRTDIWYVNCEEKQII